VYTERIPGFAICARCGTNRGLGACHRCGLLVCRECRGDGECVFCHREQRAAEARQRNRERLRLVAHRAGVAACIAAATLAAVGAALIPDPPVGDREAHAMIVARGQVGFVAEAVGRYWSAHGDTCPASLAQLRIEGFLASPPIDPWGEPLLYGCIDSPRSFVVLSKGPDRLAGTADDISIAAP
jgi:hypothetical protein